MWTENAEFLINNIQPTPQANEVEKLEHELLEERSKELWGHSNKCPYCYSQWVTEWPEDA